MDIKGTQRGALEFRKTSSDILRPTINLLYLGYNLPDKMTFSNIAETLNDIYAPMGVEWQMGEESYLNVKRYVIGEDFDYNTIEKAIELKYRDKFSSEYYMLIVKEEDNNIGSFSDGADGFVHGIGSNVLYHEFGYRLSESTPSHELGHCNGMDEFAYDFKLVKKSEIPRDKMYNNLDQKQNTNIMGYGVVFCPPKFDFYSQQITIIREHIKIRIIKK